jgi:hypothetical protein
MARLRMWRKHYSGEIVNRAKGNGGVIASYGLSVPFHLKYFIIVFASSPVLFSK